MAEDKTPPDGTRIFSTLAGAVDEFGSSCVRLGGDLKSAAALLDAAAVNHRADVLREVERLVTDLGEECHRARRLLRSAAEPR